MKLIFDTSAIIYLMEKWKLVKELLEFANSQGHEMLIPQRVRQEFTNGNVSEVDSKNLAKVFVPVAVTLEDSLMPFFNFDSSDGAIWVISHTMHTDDSVGVIDEEFGRNICKFLGVPHTGSIGIIHRMLDCGVLSKNQLPALKNRIRSSSFFYSDELLDRFDETV